MHHSIVVSFPGNIPALIRLNYSIEMVENVQTIHCAVDEAQVPVWLHFRKFSMKSLRDKNFYTQIFSELNNSRNLSTSLFIDKAYQDIMAAEKFEVVS